MEPRNPLLDRFVLSLARSRNPRVAFVGTASGDSPLYAARFLRAFRRFRCRPSVLSLFQPPPGDLGDFVRAQDVLYVGGGNTRNLLVLWRDRGLDRLLRAAWRDDAVLAGISAGSICWFEEGLSDSVKAGTLRPLPCLGFLPGSNCPHYDGEPLRRPLYRRLVGSGRMLPGLAADDGAALLFRGRAFERAVSSRPAARAYGVERIDGKVLESEILPDYLG